MSINIHDASPLDAQLICDFNCALALETEGTRLNPEQVLKGVSALLSDASRGRYWLVKDQATPVAQIMVTYEWSDWSNANYWWLGSIYVAAEYRGRGLLTEMFKHVEQMARNDGAAALRLYVDRNNKRAQMAYRNLGMSESHYRMMALELTLKEKSC